MWAWNAADQKKKGKVGGGRWQWGQNKTYHNFRTTRQAWILPALITKVDNNKLFSYTSHTARWAAGGSLSSSDEGEPLSHIFNIDCIIWFIHSTILTSSSCFVNVPPPQKRLVVSSHQSELWGRVVCSYCWSSSANQRRVVELYVIRADVFGNSWSLNWSANSESHALSRPGGVRSSQPVVLCWSDVFGGTTLLTGWRSRTSPTTTWAARFDAAEKSCGL